MEKKDKDREIDFFWRVIGRFDSYLISHNTKAMLLVAFNTFIVTGIVLRSHEIVVFFDHHHRLAALANLFLLFAAIPATASLAVTLLIVRPDLPKPKGKAEPRHLLFAGSVSEFETSDEYHNEVTSRNVDELTKELSWQSRELARIAMKKAARLRTVIRMMMWELVPLSGVLALKIIAVVQDWHARLNP